MAYIYAIDNAPGPDMIFELFATYTTQTEADIFVRCCPKQSQAYRVGPGQYQVWVAV